MKSKNDGSLNQRTFPAEDSDEDDDDEGPLRLLQ